MLHVFCLTEGSSGAEIRHSLHHVEPILRKVHDSLIAADDDERLSVPLFVSGSAPAHTFGSLKSNSAGLHLDLSAGATPAIVAHELTHCVLDLEGYPSLSPTTDDDAADARAVQIGSAILDGEVDRRVAELGLPIVAENDAQLTGLAGDPLDRSPFLSLLCVYIIVGTTETNLLGTRRLWQDRVRRERPDVAVVGDEVLAALDHGSAMKTVHGAAEAANRIVEILSKRGVGDFWVSYRGPLIREYSRTTWIPSTKRALAHARWSERQAKREARLAVKRSRR